MPAIEDAAERLDEAQRDRRATTQLSGSGFDLDLDDAYEVQRALIARRLARGERRVGVKMGFTSVAKARQMGVDDVIWAQLTDGMQVDDGGELDRAACIHPRVEPEIAFLLGRDLAGPVTVLEALAAVDGVAPALEIIDSRYADFRFSLADVVADNASACGFVVGPWHRPDIDVGNLGLVMSFGGRAVQVGTTAAILGHPARSLAAAARLAATAEEPLRAGSIVLAGGATAAEALPAAGTVRVEMDRLGSASFRIAAVAQEARP